MAARRGTRLALRLATHRGPRVPLHPDRDHRPVLVQRRAGAATWPISGLTLDWYRQAFANTGDPGRARRLSLEAALGATVVALVLGTLAAFAVHRYRFFGRETISFLVWSSRSRCPGIVTGMALNTTFNATVGIGFGIFTIIVGHATFCVVVVYNNVIARLRRTSALDRGGVRWTSAPTRSRRSGTSRSRRSGRRCSPAALLAFALSFDEVIVTNFTAGTAADAADLDLQQLLRLPNQRPLVNVVAVWS